MRISQLVEEIEAADRLLRVVNELPDILLPFTCPRVRTRVGLITFSAVDDGRDIESNLSPQLLDLCLGLSEPEIAPVADLEHLDGVEGEKICLDEPAECGLNPGVNAEATPELELQGWVELFAAPEELIGGIRDPIFDIKECREFHDRDQKVFRFRMRTEEVSQFASSNRRWRTSGPCTGM